MGMHGYQCACAVVWSFDRTQRVDEHLANESGLEALKMGQRVGLGCIPRVESRRLWSGSDFLYHPGHLSSCMLLLLASCSRRWTMLMLIGSSVYWDIPGPLNDRFDKRVARRAAHCCTPHRGLQCDPTLWLKADEDGLTQTTSSRASDIHRQRASNGIASESTSEKRRSFRSEQGRAEGYLMVHVNIPAQCTRWYFGHFSVASLHL